MSATPEPVHLSNHHRSTLAKIFQHPVSHNVEWHDVRSLLDAVGSVDQRHDGTLAITVGGRTEFFDPRADKDADPRVVADLRTMLTAAGYSADSHGAG
jgi:hypothetical protein